MNVHLNVSVIRYSRNVCPKLRCVFLPIGAAAPTDCKLTEYKCCWDNVTTAKGPNKEGCPCKYESKLFPLISDGKRKIAYPSRSCTRYGKYMRVAATGNALTTELNTERLRN